MVFFGLLRRMTRKILILVWPEASAYNATFRLARILTQRGSEVVYAVPARWQDHITRQGFQTMCVDLQLDISFASVGNQSSTQMIHGLCASLFAIKANGFALVLLYATLWHYALVLRRFNIPYVLINPCLASSWNLDIPPIFSSLQPISTHRLLNSVRCAKAWFLLRYFGSFDHRYRGIIQPASAGGPARIHDFGVMVRHFVSTIFEEFHQPVYYRLLRLARQEGIEISWGDYGHRLLGPDLVLGPQAIDFSRPHSPHTRIYVGPCVDTERIEASFDWGRVNPLKPVVYCAVGSHGSYWAQANRLRLLNSVVEAFKARTEYQLLIQAADERECERLDSCSGNILAAPWFPQLHVLSSASFMIGHGGFGMVREALFYGVPMIIFPFGVDQPGNAARVAWSQVGLVGDIRTVTPEIINNLVDRIERPPYRDNAIKLSKSLQSENDCREAVFLIDDILSSIEKAG
jgi:zeaxanthin glucosyltransferase